MFSPAYLQPVGRWVSGTSVAYQQVNATTTRDGSGGSQTARENNSLTQLLQYGVSDGLAVGVSQQYLHNASYSPDNAPSTEGYGYPSLFLNTTAKTQGGVLVLGHFAVAPVSSYASPGLGSTSYSAAGTAVWHLGSGSVLSTSLTRTLFNRDDFYARTGESDFTVLGGTWARHVGRYMLRLQAQYQQTDAKFSDSGGTYSLYDPGTTTTYNLGLSHRIGGGEWELSYLYSQMSSHVSYVATVPPPSVDNVGSTRSLQLTYRTSF